MKGRCGVTESDDNAQRSFERAFDAHAAAVLRFVLRRLNGNAAAADVVSEAFLAAWRHWDRRPAAEEEMLSWLYRFAAHTLNNQQRSARREGQLAVRIGHLTPNSSQKTTDHATALSDVAALLAVIDAMPAIDREVLMLLAWEELTDPGDIARALRVSVATARVRIHRARHRLRDRLDRQDDDHADPERPRTPVYLPTVEPRR